MRVNPTLIVSNRQVDRPLAHVVPALLLVGLVLTIGMVGGQFDVGHSFPKTQKITQSSTPAQITNEAVGSLVTAPARVPEATTDVSNIWFLGEESSYAISKDGSLFRIDGEGNRVAISGGGK